MRSEDQGPYLAATVLSAGGMVLGYAAPVLGGIAAGCGVLAVIAARLDDGGGTPLARLVQPLAALGRWLGQGDGQRLVRLAPFIGLVAGALLHGAVQALQAQGGA
jgi:hypothetical protein